MKKVTVTFCAVLFFSCWVLPLYGQDDVVSEFEQRKPQPTAETIVADLILVRPISLVALALGAGLSILATPFAAASGTTGDVYRRLVVDPYTFAICRPLGEF